MMKVLDNFYSNLYDSGSCKLGGDSTLDVIVKAFESEKAQLKAQLEIYKAKVEEAEKKLADIRKLLGPSNVNNSSSQYVWQLQSLTNQHAQQALADCVSKQYIHVNGMDSKGLK